MIANHSSVLGVVKEEEHEDFFYRTCCSNFVLLQKIKERRHFNLDCGKHQASIQACSKGVSFVCFLLVLMGLFS